jgi:hypothetical protein
LGGFGVQELWGLGDKTPKFSYPQTTQPPKTTKAKTTQNPNLQNAKLTQNSKPETQKFWVGLGIITRLIAPSQTNKAIIHYIVPICNGESSGKFRLKTYTLYFAS